MPYTFLGAVNKLSTSASKANTASVQPLAQSAEVEAQAAQGAQGPLLTHFKPASPYWFEM